MARIFYGMAGEGRGHATRGRAIIEALRAQHQVTLFTSDCAYAMLAPLYRGTDVRVVAIEGLSFAYGDHGQVALARTLADALRFRFQAHRHVEAVLPEFERHPPDLVIADFEPILPRAARACGIPFVSFDHQHYLVVSDLSALPAPLRRKAALASPCVRALYDWQRATIVSSFFSPPLKPAHRDAIQVGVLIRPELARLQPQHDRHLVVYMRRFASPEALAALAASGREVRVYGLGARPSEGSLRFLEIDEQRFLEDLASCDAVVSTAGNQLVGEALAMRKPMLVLPEARNFEQLINAFYLEQSGAGWAERGVLTAARLGAFLESIEALRARIRPEIACGRDAALAAISAELDPPSRRVRPSRPPVRSNVRGAQWV